MAEWVVEFAWGLAFVAAAGVALATLMGFGGRLWWCLDWFSHFRVQYAVLLGAAALVFAAAGRCLAASLWGLFALLNVGIILPLYFGRKAGGAGGKPCRALLCNVLQENRRYQAVLQLIEASQADIIVLLETGEAWMEALAPLRERYPFYINRLWGGENYDIALFSRLPFTEAGFRHFEANRVPSVVARFDWGGRCLTIIGTHPAPPKSRRQFLYRNEHLNQLARFAAAQPGEVMVMGDLNLTSWSPFFGNVLRCGRLQDSRQGFGVQPTWPTTMPWLMIPLDHVLASAGIRILRRTVGPPVGSDHRPVMVDFTLA